MKLYTENQVATATFLGSPIAGGILMARNAKRVGQKGGTLKFIGITVAATVALGVIAFLLPDRKPGDYLLPLLAAFAMRYWYKKAQGDFILCGKFPEASKASWWSALGTSLLVAIGIMVLLFGGLMLVSGFNRGQQEPAFIPDSNNGKEMVVRGWTSAELNRILADFQKIYEGRLGAKFALEVHPPDHGSIRVTFPHDIPALEFSFLINYVQYPKDLDLKTHSILVIGKAPLSADFQVPDRRLVGQFAIFYVPSNDRDYDLVYVRVGHETFENSFAADIWKKVTDSRLPPGIETLL